MIEIREVRKVRGRRVILDQVTCAASRGRVTALLGRNGAGKSSLLRILLGLDRADAGEALVNGTPYVTLRRPLLHVGSVLDGCGAHASRTGRDHLRWIACSQGIPKARVEEVLAQVGLTDAARRRVRGYSLGMGQRLGIAAALLGSPSVLVLDEPTNGLDAEGIRWLRGLLRQHATDGGTVLLSSHQMADVAELADDVVILAGGRVRAAAPIETVQGHHASLEDAFFALTEQGPQ